MIDVSPYSSVVERSHTSDKDAEGVFARFKVRTDKLREAHMKYVIRNITDPTLFWSNDYGWVDWPTCDEFSEEDKMLMDLPIEGKWEKV